MRDYWMSGRGRGIHKGLKEICRPRGADGRFISKRPTVDPFAPNRALARSPPLVQRISLSPSAQDVPHTTSELDTSPNFGELSFHNSNSSQESASHHSSSGTSTSANSFEQFVANFNRNSGNNTLPPPPPPPLPGPYFLRLNYQLRRKAPRMALTIDMVQKLIPHCDSELKNLAAFVGTCDLLHDKLEAASRPLFCLAIRSKAVECNLYELYKDLSPDASWADLKAALLTEVNPPMSRTAAQTQMTGLKQKGNESIQDYAKRARGYLRQLNEANCADATSEEMKKFVKMENERMAKRAFEDGISSADLRMYTRTMDKKSLAETIEVALDNEARMVPVRPILTCSHCKKTGHNVENCFAKKNEQKVCNLCKQKGHTEEACRKKPAPKETPKPPDSSAENKNAHITCNYCKEKGHYANECPKRSVPPKNVKFAQRVDYDNAEDLSSEMEYVAGRFQTQVQINHSENSNGQNA